jgi:hypothetical protein
MEAIMQSNQDSNDSRYSDGLVRLRTLRALFSNLQDPQPSIRADEPIPKEIPLETRLLEKCRNRALAEYNDHQVKAHAFHMLSDRYRELGLDDVADGYRERADMEHATTRGFESVVKAYEKKLEDAQFREFIREEPAGDLERAGQYLESYNGDHKAFEDHTLQVLKAEQSIKELQVQLSNSPSTSIARKQVQEIEDRQDRLMRMAENEALSASVSYKSFQSEIKAAEKTYDALSRLNRADLEKTGTEGRSSNPSRINKLAVGVVAYQALKVLDHEL